MIRTNPKLWEQVKKEIQADKKWNARIAQQAVQEYKRRGGKYKGSKPTSLSKWTKEDWGYVGTSKLYLPKKVRAVLTPKQEKEFSRGKKLGRRKEYSEELIKIMKKKNVL